MATVSGSYGGNGRKSAPSPIYTKDEQALLHAAVVGDEKVIRKLLTQDRVPNLDVRDNDGNSALHILTGFNNSPPHMAALRTLVGAKGIDVNLKGHSGHAPLHTAILSRNEKAVEILMAHPDINLAARNNSGYTPIVMTEDMKKQKPDSHLPPILAMLEKKEDALLMHKAIAEGDYKKFEELQHKPGVNMNAPLKGVTPIYAAITNVIKTSTETGEIAENRVKIAEALINDLRMDKKAFNDVMKIPGIATALATAAPGEQQDGPRAKIAQLVAAKYNELNPKPVEIAATEPPKEKPASAAEKPDPNKDKKEGGWLSTILAGGGVAGLLATFTGMKIGLPLIAAAAVSGIALLAGATTFPVLALGGGAAAVAYLATSAAKSMQLEPPVYADAGGKANPREKIQHFQEQLRQADEQAAQEKKGDLHAAATQYHSGAGQAASNAALPVAPEKRTTPGVGGLS